MARLMVFTARLCIFMARFAIPSSWMMYNHANFLSFSLFALMPCIFFMDKIIGKLSPTLFWDVDQILIDASNNGRWLVERVLEWGNWEDWLVIRGLYGKSGLRQLMPTCALIQKAPTSSSCTAHHDPPPGECIAPTP
jgi:hypothetical protein